jgi:hypothetical protein
MTLSGTVAFLLPAAACAGDGSTATNSSQAHEVWYRADGTGTAEASYTLRSDDGGTVQGDINLPLVNQKGETGLTFEGFKSGDFVYLSVQNTTAAGAVTCRIIVDGKEISHNTSSGGYKIASCSSRVP